ncbi:MAG: beta-lactamase family protein [Henriciella sp.]|nr:beta-lactamase family protein [Henriciella sp.]
MTDVLSGLTRRHLLGAVPFAALVSSGCGSAQRPEDILSQLIDGPALARAPAAGFVIMKNNLVIAQAAVGEAHLGERAFTTRTALRAASISKLAVALTAEKLHHDGAVDFDKGIRNWLPFYPPDTVAGPDGPSLRALLSHTGGMKDPEIYWVEHPGQIETLLTRDAFRASLDFEYCNLAYGVVASALEVATQRRFDRLARDLVLKPMGLDAGFNWSGVSTGKMQSGATLYRETTRGWVAQTDDTDILNGESPFALKQDGADLNAYEPGTNGTLFSPQGGLRASLMDLATIAGRLAYAPELTRRVWQLDAGESNGVHDQRYFTEFGTGVQIHPATESLWPGYELWGHPGEAYGLYSGAWFVPALDISFAYAVTGTPETPPPRSAKHPALNTFTERLMDAVIAAYAASPASR